MAIADLSRDLVDTVTFLDNSNPYAKEAGLILSNLLEGKKDQAAKYVLQLIEDGMSIKDCYLRIFQPIQYEVGRLWHANQVSVAQEHFVTSASQLIMSQFYPLIMNHNKKGKTLVAACISGEQHEMGLRMVTDLMEMESWDTYFLGANTPINAIPEHIISKKADLLAVSVTLSTHLQALEELINKVHYQLPYIKILVGGYPFNVDNDLWLRIGADGFGKDAQQAIETANRLVS